MHGTLHACIFVYMKSMEEIDMFKRVIKEKWKSITLITLAIAAGFFLFMFSLLWFSTVVGERDWEFFVEEMKGDKISLMMGIVAIVIGPPILYAMKKQELEVEDRVKAFTEKHKIGDKIFAVRRKLTYNPEDTSTIFNDVFHLKVEKIDRKNRFFQLSDEFRPKWHPRKTGMSDFIVFKNKSEITAWLKGIQLAHSENPIK